MCIVKLTGFDNILAFLVSYTIFESESESK